MCDVVFGINLYEESRVAKGFPSMLSYEMRSNGESWVASLLTGASAAAVVVILAAKAPAASADVCSPVPERAFQNVMCNCECRTYRSSKCRAHAQGSDSSLFEARGNSNLFHLMSCCITSVEFLSTPIRYLQSMLFLP